MPDHPHINADGKFQSDKYPTTPAGKVPLSTKDPTAQDLLWTYAQRRRAVDADFAQDLETCLRADGFKPPVVVDESGPRPSAAEQAATRFGDKFGRMPGRGGLGGGGETIAAPPIDQARIRAAYARVFDDPKVVASVLDLVAFLRSCLSRDATASEARRFLFPHPKTHEGWLRALKAYTDPCRAVYVSAMLAYFGFGADYTLPPSDLFNAAAAQFFAGWERIDTAGDVKFARMPDPVTPPTEPHEP